MPLNLLHEGAANPSMPVNSQSPELVAMVTSWPQSAVPLTKDRVREKLQYL